MTIEHHEHWYLCDECGGTGLTSAPAEEPDDHTDWWCPSCGDGMSQGLGYIEGDDDDCEDNPCDVATGAMTL